ncbi:Na+ H+ antiporter CNH1 protein [Rutstroemia sp. NJR-2017a BBW]|nr:Na+ H+ antiporter CNH1 protein [Rutstroemia sp. NJR-2017a BBW]
MYVFVMEQLGQLEERLLELVTETEISANTQGSRRWTLVPKGMASRGGVAMSWLAVRTKALELVRQRDALGARVLFSQMSMMSSRVRDQESRAKKQEDANRERLDRLETMVYSQHEKLDRLESLVYRLMHRTRLASETEPPFKDDTINKYDFFTVHERRRSLPDTSSTGS